MPQIHLPAPVDEDAFRNGLTEYLRIAEENDVPIERAWECPGEGSDGWEAVIAPIATGARTPDSRAE